MFGSGKIKELESTLISTKMKLEDAEKEKTKLEQDLRNAKTRIRDLEKQLEESEGAALQEQARKTIVEYEGLKDLYLRKTRELEDIREQTEESFAVEAANKRHNLSEEIQAAREENQNMVSDTVRTFAGSYQYYLDQIRGLMDALSEAARETGESLFSENTQSIKERFGTRILEHLQNNASALKQNTGDLMLIGAEEAPAAIPEAVEEAVEEAAESVQETVEEAPDSFTEETEGITEAADEAAEAFTEEFEKSAESAPEVVGEAVEEIAEDCAEIAEETVKEEEK